MASAEVFLRSIVRGRKFVTFDPPLRAEVKGELESDDPRWGQECGEPQVVPVPATVKEGLTVPGPNAAITPTPAQGSAAWSPGHLRFLERQSDTEFTPVGWRQEERAEDLFKAGLLEREQYVWKVKSGGRRREYDWAYRRTEKGRDVLASKPRAAGNGGG